MALTYIKKKSADDAADKADVSERVREMLGGLRERRETDAVELARQFDGWEGPVVVAKDTILCGRADRVWNERYEQLADELGRIEGVRVPVRDPREKYVASSIQFKC